MPYQSGNAKIGLARHSNTLFNSAGATAKEKGESRIVLK